MNLVLYLSVAVATLVFKSSCFNIDARSSSIRTITNKENKATIRKNPTFFGYDVSIKKIASTNQDPAAQPSFDLYAGAPKTVNSTNPSLQDEPQILRTQGSIQICRDVSFSKKDSYCNSTNLPPDSRAGDAYGLSVAIQQDGDTSKLVACSPTKTQICGSTTVPQFNSPGYCYDSSNLGEKWTPDPKTADLSCNDFNLDLIFVLDGSGSVGSDFKSAKNWVAEVASNFVIRDKSTRIGVIQYSYYVPNLPLDKQPYIVTEIELGQYSNQEELRAAINSIKLQSFTTHTASALNLSALNFEKSPRFNWANTSKVLVLLTDGNSTDASELPVSANLVRSLNVTTFAIGVGDIVEAQLRTIATGNESSSDRVYSIDNYEGLKGITQNLKRAITRFVLEGSSPQSTTAAGYTLQLAEYGFSLEPSKLTSPQRLMIEWMLAS